MVKAREPHIYIKETIEKGSRPSYNFFIDLTYKIKEH